MYLVLLALLVAAPQIPGDCPPPCDCKWKSGKESVICTNGNLTKIPPHLDSSTQLLDLTGNQIATIVRDAFNSAGLLNLQKIYVAKCRIKTLDRYAFRKLINLVELDLSYNAITTVPSHVFDSISELRELKLSGNPIQRILNDAFINVPQLVKLEISDCKLGTIEPRAFSGLEHTLEWLKLDKNRIVDVKSSTLTSLLSLHGLELSGNPWNCSCELRPLRQWMLSQNIPSSVPASCRYPVRLAGRSWDRLGDDEFACPPSVTPLISGLQTTEGQNLTMSCRVSGSPHPSVKWIWKNRAIANASGSSPHHKKMYILHYIDKISTLTIYSVEPNDAGVYLCVAANKAGKAESNVTLSVAKRPPENRVSGKVILVGAVLLIVFVVASCLLFCLLSQPKKQPRVSRQDSYEKIEMNKKSEKCYSEVSVVSKVHPKMNEYRGIPSGEEGDGDDEGGTPSSQASEPLRPAPTKPTKLLTPDIKASAKLVDMCRESELFSDLGVQQHVLRKEVLARGSLYTTAVEERNYPDLVSEPTNNPKPSSSTLPRYQGKSWYPGRVSSSQSPLLAGSRCGSSGGDSGASTRRFSIDSRSASYYRLGGGDQRSASSLNLCYNRSNTWHHPSLPSSPVRSPGCGMTETPILNPLGVSAEVAAMTYDYHAAQLERFLEEYRTLQQQLSRMKENLRARPQSILKTTSEYFPSNSPDRDVSPYWKTRNTLFNDIFQS